MSPRPTPRWAAPVATLVSVVASVLLLPALALADEPASDAWGDVEGYSTLYVVLVFVGGPVALFLLLTVVGSIGKHRVYPRPVLGEEAAIEAAEEHGEALRRSTGHGDEEAAEQARERTGSSPTDPA